jgi:hypothetical protein
MPVDPTGRLEIVIQAEGVGGRHDDPMPNQIGNFYILQQQLGYTGQESLRESEIPLLGRPQNLIE